jgi:hypothetical protein
VYKNVPRGVLKKTIKLIIRSHVANLQFLWREQRVNFLPYLFGVITGLVTCPLFFYDRYRNLRLRVLSDNELFAMLLKSNPPVIKPFMKLRNLLK